MRKSDKELDISVRDTGCGIPAEIKNGLFQVFGTYDHNKGSNRHGVGLGLTIAKKLVQELGPTGEIVVESQPGQGTSFTFTLYAEESCFRASEINDLLHKISGEGSIQLSSPVRVGLRKIDSLQRH